MADFSPRKTVHKFIGDNARTNVHVLNLGMMSTSRRGWGGGGGGGVLKGEAMPLGGVILRI